MTTMLTTRSSPFGGQTRTSVLLALCLLEESFPRELARLLDVPLYGVQRALGSLESAGLVAGRSVGRTRVYRLNPRYFALRELAGYLRKLSEAEPELRERVSLLRRRPRRTGKPL
jgi:DNA-binding transcriptional ArsR family regulator